jgi:sRNA-binding regulator protein Hfq
MQLGLHFTPLAAHESSERSIHYGPSEVIHIEDFKKGKYILGKYDKWVSCDTVNRVWHFFWTAGNQPIGFENDKTKAVSYTWMLSSYNYFKAYGIINDKNVKRIEITLSNGEVLTQTDFYEDLFLLTLESKGKENVIFKAIRGYDAEDKLVYEDEY